MLTGGHWCVCRMCLRSWLGQWHRPSMATTTSRKPSCVCCLGATKRSLATEHVSGGKTWCFFYMYAPDSEPSADTVTLFRPLSCLLLFFLALGFCCLFFVDQIDIPLIIMYIYPALINALSAHMIHINLHMIFCTHAEHSATKNNLHKVLKIF